MNFLVLKQLLKQFINASRKFAWKTVKQLSHAQIHDDYLETFCKSYNPVY